MKKQYVNRCISDGTSALASKPCEFTLLEGGASVAQDIATSTEFLNKRSSASYCPLSRKQLFVAALALVAIVCFLVSTYNLRAAAIENEVLDKLQYAPVETITVQPGDSLWKIAEDHNVSGVSTTDMVRYVQKINHISSDRLVSGQLLKIPVA